MKNKKNKDDGFVSINPDYHSNVIKP
jgi:hypothetical protein